MQTDESTNTTHVYTAALQREPPPYPNYTRPLFQPGLRQSYSGSETSTEYSLSSCENLSSTTRQEPQGEETRPITPIPRSELRPLTPDNIKIYRDMLARLGLSEPPPGGTEIKPPPGYNVNVPNSIPTAGLHDNDVNKNYVRDLVQQQTMHNNNNNIKCYPSGANQDLAKNFTLAEVQQPMKPPPAYQSPVCAATSPSVTMHHTQGGPEGSSPIPPSQHNRVAASMPGTPASTPGTPASAPGTPGSTPGTPVTPRDKYTPQAGPVVSNHHDNMTPQPQLQPPIDLNTCCSAALVTSSRGLEQKPRIQKNLLPMSLYSNSFRVTESMQSSSDESPTQEESQPITQNTCMSQPLGHNVTQPIPPNHQITQATQQALHMPMVPMTSKKQRPFTAPTCRQLPLLPAPPPYYQNIDLSSMSLKKQPPEYVWSQPDLTRLAGLHAMPKEEHLMSSPEQEQSQPITSLDSGDAAAVTSSAGLADTVPALSTSSSTSSLLQYHAQQLALASARDPSLFPAVTTATDTPLYSGLTGTTATVPDINSSSELFQGTDPTLLDPSMLEQSILDPVMDLAFSSHDPLLASLGQIPASQSHAAVATRATKMVERLSEENCLLRQELEGFASKVYRLQKLESEMQKVHENYENLEKHTQKQESIEKLIRHRLVSEIKQLRNTNKELKDHLDKSLRQLQQKEGYPLMDADVKKELLGKDSLIANLITQNRDLTLTKEQLETEVLSHKSSLHEHQNRIVVLNSSLNTARADISSYKEQVQKRNAEDKKITELHKALTQLQCAVEKRETIEQKLRQKLEEEVQHLRRQQATPRLAEMDEGIASDSESPTSLQGLLRQMQEKEQRVLMLEAETAKWKQKYFEELAMRQFAVDAASVPKDARIAVLEQNSVETEKLIAEARTERIQHIEEVHVTNQRCAELENRVKSLQAQLAEKDALILILQRRSQHTTSSLASLLSSPLHSPCPSCLSPLGSPCHSPLNSTTHSGASSRQNSQLDNISPDTYCPKDANVQAVTKAN